jgi:hypothetical protein
MPDTSATHDPATPPEPETRAAGVVVFLIDESAALEARIAGGTKSKAESIATALNSLLNQLASGRAIDIALVGYRAGPDGQADVGVRWAGPLAGRKFVSSPQLPAAPLAVEQRTRKVPAAGGGVAREEQVPFPVWYRPVLGGALARARALEECLPLLQEWTKSAGPWVRPPLLVHLVGELSFPSYATDVLERLRQLTTPAGPPLLFHAHLASSVRIPATLYPSSDLHLPPGGPQELFQASSVVPAPLASALAQSQVALHPGARGLIFNVQLTDLIRFFTLVKAYAAWQPPQPAPPAVIPSAVGVTSVAPDGSGATKVTPTVLTEPPATSTSTESSAQTSLLVLLLDRSSERPGEPGAKNVWSRIQQQANELLAQIAKRARAPIDVALLAYGGEASGATSAAPAWAGPLAGRPWVRDTELAAGPLRVDEAEEQVSNGIGGLVSVHRKRPIYVELEPTPVADPAPAFAAVGELVGRWRRESSSAGAVLVLHLTRGCQPPDFKPPADAAEAVMLAHMVLTESPHRSLSYPAELPAMEAPELVRLWELSSPCAGLQQVSAGRPALPPGSRALVVNGKFDLLWECLSPRERGTG